MAIFDKASPGILGRASEWMTPERAIAMQGLGAIVGQVSAGQPVNASPAYNALLQRQQRSQQERMLNESGLLERFSPEQRSILAQMEPGAAQQIIAQTLFREPPAPTKGVEINGRLVDPYTGREIANFADEPTPEGWRNMTPEEIQATPGLEPGRTYQVGISGANTGKIVPAGGQALVNVDMGDDMTPGQKAVDSAYAPEYIQWIQGGGADTMSQTAQIGAVLEQLEAGEELTGPMIGLQGDIARSILNPNAQQAKDQVESVVQRSLRETLGAQFTANEGDRLIARAYNVNLPPAQNAARLRALYATLEAAGQAKQAMADYFAENGTLMGMPPVRRPSADDIIAAMDAAAPFEPAGDQGALGIPDFSAMSDEELDAWIAENGQ